MQDGLYKQMGGRLAWLDDLKGILCMLVFFGHFYIMFFWADIVPVPSRLNNILILLSSGCVTVPLFCCISGFLLEKKRPAKFYDLELSIINRFLRFEIPLLPVFFTIMLLLRKTCVFDYVNLLASGLKNKDFPLNYFPEVHFTHLYKKTFYDLKQFVGPLWMIKSLFFGGVLIYTKNYILNLVRVYESNFLVIAEILLYFCAVCVFRNDIPGLAVILGSFISRSLNFFLATLKDFFCCLLFAVCCLLHVYVYMSFEMNTFYVPRFFYWEGLFFAIILFVFFLVINKKRQFNSVFFNFLGKISFGVYVIHDFVNRTFACVSIYYLKNVFGYEKSVICVFFATVLLVVFVSYLFSYWERMCYWFIKKMMVLLEKN